MKHHDEKGRKVAGQSKIAKGMRGGPKMPVYNKEAVNKAIVSSGRHGGSVKR